MAGPSKGKKVGKQLGTGKVTPVQIAFILDRYLADNNYTATLAAFRAEAHDHFSKTKGKEAPKGLLGLGDILDEYITLKEQRVMVDQEKRRVEAALSGIQEVMRSYFSSGDAACPPPVLPSQSPLIPLAPVIPGGMPMASFFPIGNPSNGSPTVNGAAVMNYTQPPVLPKATEPNNFSNPMPKSSAAKKRKASKAAPKAPPAPKKTRTQTAIGSSPIESKTSPSQQTCTSNSEWNVENLSVLHPTTNSNQITESSVQGSLVSKNLFKHQAVSRANSSSPKTPPQTFPSQTDKSVSPQVNSSLHTTHAATSCEIASGNSSVISSGTVLVSPFKRTGYYSVERSYRVTSSPFKSSPKKLDKRDQIKGRLHFDDPVASMSLENPVATGNSTSSADEEAADTFDYDLPDLDIFNGDFSFSELLADIDLDCAGLPSTCELAIPDHVPGPEQNPDNQYLETNQNLAGSCPLTARGVLSEKDINIQGTDSLTSLTTITKCINISSPAKSRSYSSPQQTKSPTKLASL